MIRGLDTNYKFKRANQNKNLIKVHNMGGYHN